MHFILFCQKEHAFLFLLLDFLSSGLGQTQPAIVWFTWLGILPRQVHSGESDDSEHVLKLVVGANATTRMPKIGLTSQASGWVNPKVGHTWIGYPNEKSVIGTRREQKENVMDEWDADLPTNEFPEIFVSFFLTILGR